MDFLHKTPDLEKLKAFGFRKEKEGFLYQKELFFPFELIIRMDLKGYFSTQIMDVTSGEEYVLHRVQKATGSFVGKIKAAYNETLLALSDCFFHQAFQSKQAQKIISHIQKRYQDSLEYLWEKNPQAAICRRKDNHKWYAVFQVISLKKLGLKEDRTCDILNLKLPPALIETLIKEKGYALAYHMNKKHWITLILNQTIPLKTLKELLQMSYDLVA